MLCVSGTRLFNTLCLSTKKLLLIGLGLFFSLSIHLSLVSANSSSPEELLQQGKNLYHINRFAQAEKKLQQAAKLYQSGGDTINTALALSYFSLTAQKLGQWQQARQAITTSINLLTQLKYTNDQIKDILALAYNTLGELQLAQGNAQNAFESWKKATEFYRQVNDKIGYLGSLINSANALQSLGLYRRALELLKELEPSIQVQTDSLLKIAGLQSLGNALRVSGELTKSQDLLQKSLILAEKLKSPLEESLSLLSLGNTAFAFGNKNLSHDTTGDNFLPWNCGHHSINESAKNYYNQSVAFYTKILEISTSNVTIVEAQLNRLRALLELGQQPIQQELQTLYSRISSLPPSQSAVYAKVNFARSLKCFENNNIQIVELLTSALQQAKQIKDTRGESYALGNLGQVYEQNQQWSVAQLYTESALNLAQMINAADIAYQWQWQLGRLLWDQQDTERSATAYSTAIDTLKSIRSDLISLNAEVQFDFRDQVEPIYRQFVALLLQPDQPTAKNLKTARHTIEALQLAELDNFFRDPCIIIQPTAVDQIVDNANPPTAVIYPIILANRIEVIVKLPRQDELRHYRTYKLQSEVESILEALQQKLQQRYTFRDREIISQQVYNWLIKPLEQDLAQNQIKHLVFVLDGSLRNIPPTALYDGKQYLLEKYSIAISPGLQLLVPSLKRTKYEVLAAGITESHLGFSPLPNVGKELDEIKALVPSKEFINQEFTDKHIQNEVSSVFFPVIHLATHGRFSSRLEENFILAWDGKIGVTKLQQVLQTREQIITGTFHIPPPIELLVLSACETARGDKRATLGLAGIAVRSGARSTLASLWEVDDKSTSILMGEFYHQLVTNSGITKAEALRRAQELIFKNYQEHPYYWAPYVLVGNWF